MSELTLNLERLREEVEDWVARQEERPAAFRSLAQDAGCDISILHKLTGGQAVNVSPTMAERILLAMGLDLVGSNPRRPVLKGLKRLKPQKLKCEDCGKEITDPDDYRPLDLFRPQKGASGKRVWNATTQQWVRRPAQGPKKRARRNGRRFRVYTLCRKCAGEALRQRAAKSTRIVENGVSRTLKTSERVAPKRGGRPRLLTDTELHAAYKIYCATTLSRNEIGKRLWEKKRKGTLSGYRYALLTGWRRLGLPLTRDVSTQIGMSLHGTDGTKHKSWKKRCKARLKNGERCTQWVRVIREESSSHPADDGLCWNHAHWASDEKIAA